VKKIGFIAAFLAIVSFLGVIFFAKDFDVEITEQTVQQAIKAKIADGPIESRGVSLTLNNATVDFQSNNTASIVVDFAANGYGYAGRIDGNIATGLRYDAPKIYLADIDPGSLNTEFDPETEGKLNDLKNVASDFLQRQKKEMLSDEARQSLDNIVGRNEDKMAEYSAKAVDWFFTTIPVYDLNDAGIAGSLASLALKDVRFTDTAAVVTLSPSQAIFKILSFIFTALAVFAFIWLYVFGVPSGIPGEIDDEKTS